MIIELDTVLDTEATAEDAGRAITSGYQVTFTVVTEHGPAGGHPVLRFEGEASELRALVHAHYDKDTLEVVGLL
ncbi:MAG TPA: hypothetical protein VGK49_05100 [Ilumatobacteraceae bacterium]